MKTFFKYFLAIVIVYFLVNISSFYILKSTYKTKEYSVENSLLDINVTEVKATVVNGYVKGTVKNNTNAQVKNKYLKLDSYSKRDVLLGTKYIKIKDLNSNEEVEYESSFNYQQVDHVKISIIDGTEVPPQADLNFDNPEDAKVNFLIILAAFMLIV